MTQKTDDRDRWFLQWARLCTAFLEEAKWFVSGHFPGADEYLKNGIVSSGVHVVLVHMFFLIGDGSTKERAEFVKNDTCLISYHVAAILRLWDDLGSAKVTTFLDHLQPTVELVKLSKNAQIAKIMGLCI